MVNWLQGGWLCGVAEGNNSNFNCNNRNLYNNNGSLFGIVFATRTPIMENESLYPQVYSYSNLFLAYRKARKHKTKRPYVIEFEKNLIENLIQLQKELKRQTYFPKTLKIFILRDPKTRKISKSEFRDRIVHHALHKVIEPLFDKSFIYDSCANRKGKGNLFALKRFEFFKRKVTHNLKSEAFCLKADIEHYFQEVNHEILIEIIRKKISDEKVIWLIKKILRNYNNKEKGMPLGNLTSQFFANVYLNELDYFIKHELKAKYYIRYVDDFIIFHPFRSQLKIWKKEINRFLKENLKLELHPHKSRIAHLSQGIDFVGFRNYWHYKLIRKRSLIKIKCKINDCDTGKISKEKLLEVFQGWNAYAKWANTFKLREEIGLFS